MHGEIGADEMHARQRFANISAMPSTRATYPHPFEKSHEGSRTARHFAKHLTRAVLDRLRAGPPARGEMLHQAKEEGQIGRCDPLLVKCQDKVAVAGVDEKVRILDAFG